MMSKQKGFYPKNETTQKAKQAKAARDEVTTDPTAAAKSTPDAHPEHRYTQFEGWVAAKVADIKGPVFLTNANPDTLWTTYLEAIPDEFRQHYNCNCCRRFVQKYGGLVTIDEGGNGESVLWSSTALGERAVPSFFVRLVTDLEKVVRRSDILCPFLWSETDRNWGQAQTGVWTHLHGTPEYVPPVRNQMLTVDQAMAELVEDYKMLSRAFADYPMEAVRQALRVLEADAVDRSEKTLGIAKWFYQLHEKIEGLGVHRGKTKSNVIWSAVATAPVGFAHVRSSMIGTLLDDIVAGLEFETIQKRWNQKMHPLQYMRPTAPPKEGQIKEAERIFAELGAEKSLERRYANLDDVLKALWVHPAPTVPTEEELRKSGGVFDHMKQNGGKKVKELELPPQSISWEKFKRTILPIAKGMELKVPMRGSYYGLATAVDKDAPPILQWDGLTAQGVLGYKELAESTLIERGEVPLQRNPVSWYFYHGGSTAHQWNLDSGTWVRVNLVMNPPHQWQRPDLFKHQPEMAMFALEGAKDVRAAKGNVGLALFPETLKTELRAVRSVIEAHSNKKSLVGHDAEAQANGLALQKQSMMFDKVLVRIKTADGVTSPYSIDRWD